MSDIKKLSQYDLPAWAAEILYDAHFSHLKSDDTVWEPTCGNGNMIAAIPAHINCIGSEIDQLRAHKASVNTGRKIITGDCLNVELPEITAVFGNPPFKLQLFVRLLDRCSKLLRIGQRAGFVIPTYFMQTSYTVDDYTKKWHVVTEHIPRDLFNGLSLPLSFVVFTRDTKQHLVGFRLYHECADIRKLSHDHQELLRNNINGSRSVWRETVCAILLELGGVASLQSIYKAMEHRRPTDNNYWKEKVRQTLQKSFTRISNATYSIN